MSKLIFLKLNIIKTILEKAHEEMNIVLGSALNKLVWLILPVYYFGGHIVQTVMKIGMQKDNECSGVKGTVFHHGYRSCHSIDSEMQTLPVEHVRHSHTSFCHPPSHSVSLF
jgi:hypothetical protein